jgi:DNA adenine methylase
MPAFTLTSSPSPGVKPPLKWAGGKRWQVPALRALWEPHSHRRLVEPFCGGLAVALGLAPNRAWLNDANPHLINFYRWAARGLAIGLPLRNDSETYYAHRSRFNALLAEGHAGCSEAAALFYYLNRTGYNGLCRFNSAGRFNVPFGRYSQIRYQVSFPAFQAAVRDWRFSSGDFTRLRLKRDDFVYADPPYDVPFTKYAAAGFSWEDQVRTARWLVRHPGPVVLTNQATARIMALYEGLGFDLALLEAPRRISCTGDRQAAAEVMATRNV